MPTYDVTSRKTDKAAVASVTADTREQAIEQVVGTAGEGESIEVLNVTETAAGTATPSSKKQGKAE